MALKKPVSLFVILTLVNIVILYKRDFFHYQPYRSYAALYGNCDVDCLKKWKKDYETKQQSEINEAKKLSASWLPIVGHSEMQKANLIGNHLYEKFKGKNGLPSSTLQQQSALNQYKVLSKDTGNHIWCGIYAGMFSLFAWSNDVVNRTIEMKFPNDAHVVNECYIPELNKWILVDATFGMLALKNEKGDWLDLQTFRNELRQNRNIYVLRNINNRLRFTRLDIKQDHLNHYYKSASLTDFYYHHTSLQHAYRPIEKVKRYFLPLSWYELYDSANRTNIWFGLKIFAFVLWLLATGLMLRQLFFK